mgnify:FL=1
MHVGFKDVDRYGLADLEALFPKFDDAHQRGIQVTHPDGMIIQTKRDGCIEQQPMSGISSGAKARRKNSFCVLCYISDLRVLYQ